MDGKGEMKLSIVLQHQIHWFVLTKFGHTVLLKMTKSLTMSTAIKNAVGQILMSWGRFFVHKSNGGSKLITKKGVR